MRVCFDTNTFIRIFSRAPAYVRIRQALLRGRISLVISNEIALEYREIVEWRSRFVRWENFEELIETLRQLHGNVLEVSPQFRFAVITADPDDNKFSDCAITADADYIVTYDRHFGSLRGSGYKAQPITPEELASAL